MTIEIVDLPIENGGSFHSFLYVYQRVNLDFPMVFLWFFLWFFLCKWFSYGFPMVFPMVHHAPSTPLQSLWHLGPSNRDRH